MTNNNAKVQLTVEDFEILSTIGSGSYGIVRKVLRIRDKQIFVWKELDYSGASESQKQMLVSEVNLLRELRHEHIVRYIDRIIDKRSSMLYLIMEYCQGGDLASLISKSRRDGHKIEERFIWRVCFQLTQAIRECHSRSKYGKSVLHRDLKPANIFLDCKLNVKLGDFGLARVLKHDTSFAKTCVGTPLYMSPEQMSGVEYNEKSDIWALGCLLYELCCLRPPFVAVNQMELAAKICMGRYEKLPPSFNPPLTNLIYSLLTVEMERRPGVDVLLENKGFLQFKNNLNKNIKNNINVNYNNNNKIKKMICNKNIKTKIHPNIENTTPTDSSPPKLAHPSSNNKAIPSDPKPALSSSTTNASLSQCAEEIGRMREEMGVLRSEIEERKGVLRRREKELVAREVEVGRTMKLLEERENKCKLLEESLREKLSKADRLLNDYKQLIKRGNNAPDTTKESSKPSKTRFSPPIFHPSDLLTNLPKSPAFFNTPSQICLQEPLVPRVKRNPERTSLPTIDNNMGDNNNNTNDTDNAVEERQVEGMTPRSEDPVVGGKRRRLNSMESRNISRNHNKNINNDNNKNNNENLDDDNNKNNNNINNDNNKNNNKIINNENNKDDERNLKQKTDLKSRVMHASPAWPTCHLTPPSTPSPLIPPSTPSPLTPPSTLSPPSSPETPGVKCQKKEEGDNNGNNNNKASYNDNGKNIDIVKIANKVINNKKKSRNYKKNYYMNNFKKSEIENAIDIGDNLEENSKGNAKNNNNNDDKNNQLKDKNNTYVNKNEKKCHNANNKIMKNSNLRANDANNPCVNNTDKRRTNDCYQIINTPLKAHWRLMQEQRPGNRGPIKGVPLTSTPAIAKHAPYQALCHRHRPK